MSAFCRKFCTITVHFPAISNLLLHFKSQSSAIYEVGMLYDKAAHLTSVPQHALHERTCRAAVALRLDDEFFAVGEMKGCGGEKWGTEGITARSGVDGIETKGGKDIPCRHLPAVLIAAKSVGAVEVENAANAVHKHLRGFGATDKVVMVSHVVARLIAVRILPHHARRENRQGGGVGALVREHAVEQRGKTLAAAMLHQSLDVVLHRPEVLSRIAFANIRRVVVGTERADKCTIAAARLHIAGGGIIDVAPIACTFGKLTRLLPRAHLFGQPGDAGIVERIFEGARERPVASLC